MLRFHVDGSFIKTGSAGYGVVCEQDNNVLFTHYDKVKRGMHTNNRAELEAVIYATSYIRDKKIKESLIYTDSLVVVEGINGKAQRKSNRDLWEIIEDNCRFFMENNYKISVLHCDKKTLNENEPIYRFNVLADSLAFTGANALLI